jgi:glucose/mannose transport system substrate-binding protein
MRRHRGIWPLVLVQFLTVGSANAGDVEVLHWWTSGGEAKSIAELRRLLEAKGHQWKDAAVVGGGGEKAHRMLVDRVQRGDPPGAAQLPANNIKKWGASGALMPLDRVAKANGWDSALPAVIRSVIKYDGHYVAAPVNVHRANWMWVNLSVFHSAGAEIPKSWKEFETAADKIQKAGFLPIAHGGQPWQDFMLFDAIVLGTGGADFYRKAMVDFERSAIHSATMEQAFAALRMVYRYVDKDAENRDWDRATAMVIEGKAAMQFMGDWAKGEFAAAGKRAGAEYVCAPAPGTASSFSFITDSFVMFRRQSAGTQKAQEDLAATIMSPAFQEIFNLNKGSIPVRLDADLTRFDYCAKLSFRDFIAASRSNTLVPYAVGTVHPQPRTDALFQVVAEFVRTPSITPKQAVERFYAASRKKLPSGS